MSKDIAHGYAKAALAESKSVSAELTRLAAKVKSLRAQKKKADELVYKYMVNRGLNEFEGVLRSKLEPKQKKSRAKKGEKEKKALQLFADAGIPDPKQFWKMFQETQIKKEEEKKE